MRRFELYITPPRTCTICECCNWTCSCIRNTSVVPMIKCLPPIKIVSIGKHFIIKCVISWCVWIFIGCCGNRVPPLCVCISSIISVKLSFFKENLGILLQRHLFWFPRVRPRILHEYVGTNLDLSVRGECNVPTNFNVRCGSEARGGIRELNNICSNVTDVRDGRKIESWTDSEIRYFDS